MLSHSVVQWHIIVFAPASQGVQQENGILVSLGQQLFSCVLEHNDMTIVKWVSHLECVHCISISLEYGFFDFFGSHSVLVHPVIKLNVAQEMHFLS